MVMSRLPLRLFTTLFCAPILGLALGGIASANALEAEAKKDAGHRGPACIADDDYFSDEVWSKVVAHSCLKCHKAGGDAEDSKLVLEDPTREKTAGEALRHNRAAFEGMAKKRN